MNGVIKERIFTLGEMLCGQSKVGGDILVKNECNEVLIRFTQQYNAIISVDKMLNDELLNREVIEYTAGSDGGDPILVFIVRGMEDAE